MAGIFKRRGSGGDGADVSEAGASGVRDVRLEIAKATAKHKLWTDLLTLFAPSQRREIAAIIERGDKVVMIRVVDKNGLCTEFHAKSPHGEGKPEFDTPFSLKKDE